MAHGAAHRLRSATAQYPLCGTARAYATDRPPLAVVALAKELVADASGLSLPIRIFVALAVIHSEDAAYLPVVEGLLAQLRQPLLERSPSVHAALVDIARNHHDRVTLFGRIPERNAFPLWQSAVAFMAAVNPSVALSPYRITK